MIHFEPMPDEDGSIDLFSRAIVEEFWGHPRDSYGYRLTQVFEPYVLREIADIEGVVAADLEKIQLGNGKALDQVREMVVHAEQLSAVQSLNLASALISISRFAIAEKVLDGLESRIHVTRDAFELAMIRFVIHNRCGNDHGMRSDFALMRRVIEAGDVPEDRVLDAAAQAVVWRVKSNTLSHTEFTWFKELGSQIVANSKNVGSGSLSSWYRAVAMIPASDGDQRETTRLMDSAKSAASACIESRPGAYEQHFLKTYYESSLKQHMYVTKDLELAKMAGLDLIKIDPAWSLSYSALAEAQRYFGKHYSAAKLFEKAGKMGAPHVGHNYFNAALSYEKSGDCASAFEIYEMLHDAFPENPSVIVAALKLTSSFAPEKKSNYERALGSVEQKLTEAHLDYLSR